MRKAAHLAVDFQHNYLWPSMDDGWTLMDIGAKALLADTNDMMRALRDGGTPTLLIVTAHGGRASHHLIKNWECHPVTGESLQCSVDAPEVVPYQGRRSWSPTLCEPHQAGPDDVLCDVYTKLPWNGNSAFSNPMLHPRLQADGVDTLIVTGVYAGACIRDTIRSGVAHGYHCIVPVSLIRAAIADDTVEKRMARMQALFADEPLVTFVATPAEALELLQSPLPPRPHATLPSVAAAQPA